MNADPSMIRPGLDALDRACQLLGTQDQLALKLNIRSASISGWRQRGRVPVERCGDIERATDCRVTRFDLRPDVFGEAKSAMQKAG